MPSLPRFISALYLCTLAAVGCAPAAETPSVEFGSTDVVGRWTDPTSEESPATPSNTVATEQPTSTVAPAMPPQVISAAGRPGAVSAPAQPADAGASMRDAAQGGTGGGPGGQAGQPSTEPMPDAGVTGPSEPAPPTDVTSLRFEVTTTPVGGRYQPKNVGAIWIEDDSGNFVKSLEVWAATRRRYLRGYLAALGSASVDVTASATLRTHKTHSVTWDLRDRSGASVAPGPYRVRMELTDADTTGNSNTVDFDTSAGPVTLTPGDAPSFGAMKLELQ